MEILGLIVMGIGGIVALAGGIWFLVEAFKEDVMWGVGCIVCGFVQIAFLIMHWNRAAKPFLVQVAGVVLVLIGGAMSGNLSTEQEDFDWGEPAVSIVSVEELLA